jgi:hypothetical protein
MSAHAAGYAAKFFFLGKYNRPAWASSYDRVAGHVTCCPCWLFWLFWLFWLCAWRKVSTCNNPPHRLVCSALPSTCSALPHTGVLLSCVLFRAVLCVRRALSAGPGGPQDTAAAACSLVSDTNSHWVCGGWISFASGTSKSHGVWLLGGGGLHCCAIENKCSCVHITCWINMQLLISLSSGMLQRSTLMRGERCSRAAVR